MDFFNNIYFSIISNGIATGVVVRQCAGSTEIAERVCNLGLNSAEYCETCNKDGCNIGACPIAAKIIAIPALIATILFY